jgi:hypothetical protein
MLLLSPKRGMNSVLQLLFSVYWRGTNLLTIKDVHYLTSYVFKIILSPFWVVKHIAVVVADII